MRCWGRGPAGAPPSRPAEPKAGGEWAQQAPGPPDTGRGARRLEITHRREAGGVVLALVGEFDLAAAGRVAAAVEQALACETDIELDLSGVMLIDSSGIRVLIATVRICEALERGLRVVRPVDPGPRRVFEILGLERLMPWKR